MNANSKLKKAIISLTLAGFVYVFTFYFLIIALQTFPVPEFFIYFIASVATGLTVSKTYFNGLRELAVIGFFSPYVLFSVLITFLKGDPLLVFWAFSTNYIIIVPVVSMLSALFYKKDFRDTIREKIKI